MWFLLAFFIVLKLLVYFRLQTMRLDAHHHKICPNGFVGFAPDPFECDVYYACPGTMQFFCSAGEQFSADKQECVVASLSDGCMGWRYRNLIA